MSQQQARGLSQSKEALLKSYTIRLKDDIKAMLDNFTEVIKLARVSLYLTLWLLIMTKYRLLVRLYIERYWSKGFISTYLPMPVTLR